MIYNPKVYHCLLVCSEQQVATKAQLVLLLKWQQQQQQITATTPTMRLRRTISNLLL